MFSREFFYRKSIVKLLVKIDLRIIGGSLGNHL